MASTIYDRDHDPRFSDTSRHRPGLFELIIYVLGLFGFVGATVYVSSLVFLHIVRELSQYSPGI